MKRVRLAILGCALAAGTPLAAAPVDTRITADTSGATTRVVLTFSKAVVCSARPWTGRIEVTCGEPIRVEPEVGKLDDAILTGWKVEGDRAVVLTTGPGYRGLESFDLKNPSRLVLDLSGTRPTAPTATPAAELRGRSGLVVLDPGHGGVESGASGPTGLIEKAVTLDLSRRVERLLEKEGITVVLTRDEDRVLPLDDRTAIANQNRADLFVSIHVNASKRSSAIGAETYFLAPESTDDEARTLAALENRAYDTTGEPLPRGDAAAAEPRGLELILWDLAQNQYLAESSRLAESVQREMNELTGVRDRGVRQAPFRVLMGATMPAILVEVGFISNPDEEKRLSDEAYKDKIAEALARSIVAFKRRATEPQP